MLLLTEVFKRATHGYHFVNHHWYYWNAIVKSRVVVPPELLALGLGIALYRGFKQSDRRYLLLLSWAFLPVLVQNSMKSKLLWYILPALPGMAILVGALVGSICIELGSQYRRHIISGSSLRASFYVPLLFTLYAVGSLGYNAAKIAHDIVVPWKRNATDEMMEDIQTFSRQSGKKVHAVFYNPPPLANHESFYWNMVSNEELPENDIAGLKRRLDSGEVDFVITSITQFAEVVKQKPIAAFSFLPVRDKRRMWLAVISYVPNFLPRHFISGSRVLRFVEHPEILNYGFKPRTPLGSLRIYPSRGDKSSLLLPSSIAYSLFGSEIKLNLASTVPTATGTLDIHVFFNEEKLGVIQDVEEGFHFRTVHIPGSKWRPRMNLLSFVYELPDGGHIDADAQVALFESATIALGDGRAMDERWK